MFGWRALLLKVIGGFHLQLGQNFKFHLYSCWIKILNFKMNSFGKLSNAETRLSCSAPEDSKES